MIYPLLPSMASPYIYDYFCPSCDYAYIPYEEDFPCPFCGAESTKHFNFITEIVNNLITHKKEFGHFEPAQRTIRSTNDEVQDIVFHLLDYIESELQEHPSSDREKQANKLMNEVFENREKKYAEYLKGVILASYTLYKTNPPIHSTNYNDLWSKIRK